MKTEQQALPATGTIAVIQSRLLVPMHVEIDDGTVLRRTSTGIFQGFRTQAYEIEGKKDLQMRRQLISVRFKKDGVHLRVTEGHTLLQNDYVEVDTTNRMFKDVNGNIYTYV